MGSDDRTKVVRKCDLVAEATDEYVQLVNNLISAAYADGESKVDLMGLADELKEKPDHWNYLENAIIQSGHRVSKTHSAAGHLTDIVVTIGSDNGSYGNADVEQAVRMMFASA